MSKLPEFKSTGDVATAQAAGAAGGMTAERWLAVFVLTAFGFLVLTRRQFAEFIPR